MKKCSLILTMAIAFCTVFSENSNHGVATIQMIQGRANLKRCSDGQALNAKAGIKLRTGDTIFSSKESLVEIKFDNGEIVRLDENTIFAIDMTNPQKSASSLPVGRVWVNMKKIVTRRAFDVSTPTAVAAIRGTVYAMQTSEGHFVDLSVYDGKVDIGPSENFKKEA